MRKEAHADAAPPPPLANALKTAPLPLPTPVFRRRAWIDFQRALDPLAPPKPGPPAPSPRHFF